MRIRVAGGLGVFGRRVVPSLVRQGHTVFATTRSPTRVRALEQLDAHPIVADVLDDEAWDGATQRARPEVVLHLLTDLGTGDPTSNAHLRAVGTQSLVGAADRAGARVVAESISWVNPPSSAPADEATPFTCRRASRAGPSQESPLLRLPSSGRTASSFGAASSTVPAPGSPARAATGWLHAPDLWSCRAQWPRSSRRMTPPGRSSRPWPGHRAS
ncbi:NAD-dependent epimerase/dehydratase family protein [Arsenicicoccus piscis]|uniref:NAD-dependent epimerase/dehydratase family protein n=1 Tax=Arsenicicoccus piscis TaxID=673954 RepID=UPI003D6689B3